MRGQYDGYHDVDGVDPKSTTETYVALRLAADSWRWQDVPILIRAAKCMPVTATEIDIRFRQPPHDVFGIDPFAVRNSLRFRVWPETAVSLTLAGKKPGGGLEPLLEDLAFAGQEGSDMRPYDRLIGAALDGDRWLFARQDTVEAAWEVVDPVLGDVDARAPLRPGQLGSRGSRPAAARPGDLARPGWLSDGLEQAMTDPSGPRRVVIVGGGFAGLFAVRALGRKNIVGDHDRPVPAPRIRAAALPVRDGHPVRGEDRHPAARSAQEAARTWTS